MSALLRQLCFKEAELPVLLEAMLDVETLDYMGKPLASDIIMYQRQRAQLPNGIACNMTVMPLNWLAGRTEAESEIRLHVLVLELPLISSKTGPTSAGTKKTLATAEQCFWCGSLKSHTPTPLALYKDV
eukprot:1940743-Amphidinium_carterae.1